MDEINTKQVEINTVEGELQATIDDGNTNQLNAAVQNSQPSQSLELRDELLTVSPNLSETVMTTSTVEEEKLPNPMLRDVLVANPQAARSQDLEDALDARQNQLPNYMREQIRAAGQNMSPVEALDMTKAQLVKEREEMLRGNIKSYLEDSTGYKEDSLLLMLSFDGSLEKAYEKFFYFINKSDIANGRLVLNEISGNFNLVGKRQYEFGKIDAIMTMMDQLNQQGNTWMNIDDAQKQQLHGFASDITDRGGIWARSILSLHNEATYDMPILETEQSNGGTAVQEESMEYSYKVFPDPAKDYFIVEYCLADKIYENAEVAICAINGKATKKVALTYRIDQKVVETKELESGIYDCKLLLDNNQIDSRRITIIKDGSGQYIIDAEQLEGSSPAMLVYPNPASDEFTIEYITATQDCNNCRIQIIDMHGVEVKTLPLETTQGKKTINAANMKAGTYQVVFISEGNVLFKERLVVK